MKEEYNFEELNPRKNPYIKDGQEVFVLPAKIGSEIIIAGCRKNERCFVEGYKITAHGAYCYGSVSIPREDDPEERIWVRSFGIEVSDFGKTVFLKDQESNLIEHSLRTTDVDPEDDDRLCDGCLSKDCDYCPKDDGYKCRFCPCDTRRHRKLFQTV